MLKIWIGLVALSSFMVFEHSKELPKLKDDNSFQKILVSTVNLKPSHIKNTAINDNRDCDPENVSFEQTVFPIINESCAVCHNANFAMGSITLDSYESILPFIENGALIGSIRHEVDWKVMPPSNVQLEDCKISQIEKWIQEGARNN